MKRYLIGTTFASLLLVLACSAPAEAGSVFLKNGYILQGRIVERGEGVVVLGWQNGRVTIHDRFIDEVLLDPSEEEMIRSKRELDAVEAEQTAVAIEDFTLRSNEVIALPVSYQSILTRDTSDPGTPIGPGGAMTIVDPLAQVTTDPRGSTPGTVVGVVPSPSDLEKIFPALGVAIEVPEGWRVDEKPDSLRVGLVGKPAVAALTVDLWHGKNLKALEALRIIEDSLTSSFPSASIEAGAEMVIGGKAAISLVCRDTERRIGCRQNVIETLNGVFVLGMYLPLDADPTMALALDDVLTSLRFISE